MEKSRLSARYLSSSLNFYRKAGSSCNEAFDLCRANGWQRLVLCGISDLAEIAFVRSHERGIEVVGIIDSDAAAEHYLGIDVSRRADGVAEADAYLITDLLNPAESYERLCGQVAEERILVPDILEWRAERHNRG